MQAESLSFSFVNGFKANLSSSAHSGASGDVEMSDDHRLLVRASRDAGRMYSPPVDLDVTGTAD